MRDDWPRLRPGDAVRIRGERWRVLQLLPLTACAVLEVAGTGQANHGVVSRFLLPFERVQPVVAADTRLQVVRPRRLRAAMREALASAQPEWTSLRAAADAGVSLLPFQLEPAIAIARGLATRVLLADDVGLGKTIQAGLILAEVRARGPGARALIVTPAGLREQWRDELNARFAIASEILDAPGLARAAARLPPGMNPWGIPPVVIASIDFVKRPDVIRSLETLVWDVVVFDEAHGLAGRSDRGDAANLLASRARRLLLLSATPHSGDDRAFARLCTLGQLAGDSILMFRRGRQDAGCATIRRTSMLSVRITPAETRLHRALDAYARRVRREAPPDRAGGARLAMGVLARRACSSAAALARSVARRIALLSSASGHGDVQLQLSLPLDDEGDGGDVEPSSELGTPGLRDLDAEIAQLERLEAMAQAAAGSESKITALRRLLRRMNEPAIVFTEYRDTLASLARALDARDAPHLHGGLDAGERRREIERFTHGDARLLLATDAASEGLNLHRRCRVVINLEVPWTPLRFEQRIGRVDRLGQEHRAHAITLVARDTAETAIVERFLRRQRRAREAVPHVTTADGARPPDGVEVVSLRVEAHAEAARLAALRAMQPAALVARQASRPVAGMLHAARSHLGLYWAWRLVFVDEHDDLIWSIIVGATTGAPLRARLRSAGEVRRHLDSVSRCLAEPFDAAVLAAGDRHLGRLIRAMRESTAGLLRREQAIADEIRRVDGRLAQPLVQAGLFDRRSLRRAEAQRRMAEDALARAEDCIAVLERLRSPRTGGHALLFIAGLGT